MKEERKMERRVEGGKEEGRKDGKVGRKDGGKKGMKELILFENILDEAITIIFSFKLEANISALEAVNPFTINTTGISIDLSYSSIIFSVFLPSVF